MSDSENMEEKNSSQPETPTSLQEESLKSRLSTKKKKLPSSLPLPVPARRFFLRIKKKISYVEGTMKDACCVACTSSSLDKGNRKVSQEGDFDYKGGNNKNHSSESDSDNKSHSSSKRARLMNKRNKPRLQAEKKKEDTEDHSYPLKGSYSKMREKNIASRMELMKNLGIIPPSLDLKPQVKTSPSLDSKPKVKVSASTTGISTPAVTKAADKKTVNGNLTDLGSQIDKTIMSFITGKCISEEEDTGTVPRNRRQLVMCVFCGKRIFKLSCDKVYHYKKVHLDGFLKFFEPPKNPMNQRDFAEYILRLLAGIADAFVKEGFQIENYTELLKKEGEEFTMWRLKQKHVVFYVPYRPFYVFDSDGLNQALEKPKITFDWGDVRIPHEVSHFGKMGAKQAKMLVREIIMEVADEAHLYDC